ncbi:type I polyketide synthase [Pirellulaceae bacterium SH449]
MSSNCQFFDGATHHGIAVIGLAGRFPGAESAEHFWHNLVAGLSGVTDVPKRNRQSSLPGQPNYVSKSAVVKNGDWFDAKFFGIYPKQAIDLDPQHRLFLEICWHAMENAGYIPDDAPGRVGVFAGCHMNTYIFTRLAADPEFRQALADCFPGGGLNAEISNDKDYLATRVAYQLNLRGPSVAVQTACSTSLVAIAQACESLHAGSCDMALAGGVTVTFPQEQGYLHTEDSILSPDGTCRTFDADAKGTIFGDGVGAVVLKRLSDAIADGDDIYAFIKGWGVNNDGGDKNGYTAPSVSGQSGAIRLAHQRAGITADSISYVEAHGTGTLVGDPIEVQALTEAFRETTEKSQYCRLGSLKTNVGHLDVAAGVASLIKTCFSLKNQLIPPILHFRGPNPRIDFANSPFIVNTELTPWQTDSLPRRAGVSSFGVGGTNAHLVVEEAPVFSSPISTRSSHIIRLSAQSQKAVDEMTEDLARHLESNPNLNLADVSYTLLTGRKTFRYKRSLVASSLEEAISLLRDRNSARTVQSQTRDSNPKVVMMFPGQGSQHLNMARELYRLEPVFAANMNRCAEALQKHLGVNLLDVVYSSEAGGECLDQTEIAQPALFMVSYSLASWWQSLGVEPDVLIGHSVGEFAAAAVSRVMSLEDAAKLVALRGRLMQSLPSGSMLSVQLNESQLRKFLPASLEIAAINGPQFCVVSGPTEGVDIFANDLENGRYGEDIPSRRLRTSHAFHSRMMDPAIDEFERAVRAINLTAPQIPIVSSVTARAMDDSTATDPVYWARQIREPVRFSDGVFSILDNNKEVLILLEVGPNQALSTLARQQTLDAARHNIVSSLPQAKQIGSDEMFAKSSLSRLWHFGVKINWREVYSGEQRRRVHLPTYRFQRERYTFQGEPGLSQEREAIPASIQKTESLDINSSPPIESQKPLLNTSGPQHSPVQSGNQTSFLPPNHLIQQQMELMSRQIALLQKARSLPRD